MTITPDLDTDRPRDADRTVFSDDVLSSVVDTIQLQSGCFARKVMRAPWGYALNGPDMAKVSGRDGSRLAIFHAIIRGHGWVRSGDAAPVAVTSGDLIVFPDAGQHAISDVPEGPLISLADALAASSHDAIVSQMAEGTGPETTMVCGYFCYDRRGTHPLLSSLPEQIVIRGEDGRSVEWLETTINFVASESESNRPGYEAVVRRLGDVLFIQIIRHIIESKKLESGWLSALRDPQVAAALGAVHRAPDETWTVDRLAAEARLSRSAFARRFNELVGEPPLQYVTRWRIQRATSDLRSGHLSLLEIAERAGYGSEAAFSRAFRRFVGTSPAAYRRRAGAEA